MANNFNDFFVNVGPTLASKIPNNGVDPLSYMNTRNENSIFLEPVNATEVSKIIKEIRSASPGWDDIHAKIVKKTYLHFIQPLTYVCNLSILNGCFPTELKTAKVIPLYKADSPTVYTNYRPGVHFTKLFLCKCGNRYHGVPAFDFGRPVLSKKRISLKLSSHLTHAFFPAINSGARSTRNQMRG